MRRGSFRSDTGARGRASTRNHGACRGWFQTRPDAGEAALTRNNEASAPFPFQLLGWTRRDIVGFLVGGVAMTAIVVNVLFMQSGLHPAPMFKAPDAASQSPATADQRPAAPKQTAARGAEPGAAPWSKTAVPRMPGEIITDIQRELSRRGYYDGIIDGLYGPRTDAAIREFERSLGLKPSAQPSEMLLQTIMRSPGKGTKGVTGSIPQSRPTAIRAGNSMEPSQRVVTLQRTLAEFGYGQIEPSGVVDADTQRAIEKFEREHRLAVTGQLSEPFVRELAAVTGQSFE
jgi:peptidoglycan hydrolase-like protein with peptidoglycan-binding domain